jgi:DNA-directed RNA polymerase subunit E'/Rpb7
MDEQKNNEQKNIYISTVIENQIIHLSAKEVCHTLVKQINKTIERKLKNEYEGVCISDGYVKKGSLKLLSRKMATVTRINFRGIYKFEATFSVEICNPVKNNIISATIKDMNLIGLIAENHPMSIIIVKDCHDDQSVFDNLQIGDTISVRVLMKKYQINDTEIMVTGLLETI